MSNNLSKNILTTITYYDVMDYPMTVFEIWKYLISYNLKSKINNEKKEILGDSKCSLLDIIKELESEELVRYLDKDQGYYFLRGRRDLIAKRLQGNKISERKFKIIKRVVFWLRFVPFIKMISVAGRVAIKNAQVKSDLDIFIIFQRGKLFTGRFFATFLAHILGKRRYGKKIKDRICLNHFLTDEYELCVKDLYSSQVYSFLMPVYNGLYLKEFFEKNDWILTYRPNFEVTKESLKEVQDSFFSKLIRGFLEKVFCFDVIERKMRKWQIEKIKNNPKTKKLGGMIIYNKKELAFWPDFEKQGPRFFETFYNRISKFK